MLTIAAYPLCRAALCSWDAELFGTYGWVEVVGHADRSAYDLRVHSAKSKVELVAQETFEQPRMMEVANVKANWPLLGKTYGKQPAYKLLQDFLKGLPDDKDEAVKLRDKLSQGSVASPPPNHASLHSLTQLESKQAQVERTHPPLLCSLFRSQSVQCNDAGWQRVRAAAGHGGSQSGAEESEQ